MTKKEYLDRFIDELHQWSLSGREPSAASRDLRYFLDCRERRLSALGLSLEENHEHVKDEVSGDIPRNGHPYRADVIYREAVQEQTYRRNGRLLKRYRTPVIFYASMLEKDGYEDFVCTCPNCGNTAMASEMREGCPYCGTVFEIEDAYPQFTGFFTVSGIVSRSDLNEKLPVVMKRIFALSAVILTVISVLADADYVWWFRLLKGLFTGAFGGGLITLLSYMAFSLFLLVKVMKEAGRSVPLLKGAGTKKKLEDAMKPYDPDFSYEYFEGKLISLLRTAVFSDDRSSLSILRCENELSKADRIVDMEYRGASQLVRFKETDGMIRISVKAFMTCTYADRRIYRRDRDFLVTLERSSSERTDPGFTVHKVQCASCGGSFDSLHLKYCPHCGMPYELKHKDWVITSVKG